MMPFLRNLMLVLIVFAMFIVSLVGLMVEFPLLGGMAAMVSETGKSIVATWRLGGGMFWIWLALFLACLVVVLTSLLGLRETTRFEVQMEHGRVVLLASAIKKYIRAAAGEVRGFQAKRIDLRSQMQGLRVDIYAQVQSAEKLPELEQQVIHRVRSTLFDKLGINRVAAVNVYIRDVTAPTASPAPIVIPPAPAPSAPSAPPAPAPFAAEESPRIPWKREEAEERAEIAAIPFDIEDTTLPTPEEEAAEARSKDAAMALAAGDANTGGMAAPASAAAEAADAMESGPGSGGGLFGWLKKKPAPPANDARPADEGDDMERKP